MVTFALTNLTNLSSLQNGKTQIVLIFIKWLRPINKVRRQIQDFSEVAKTPKKAKFSENYMKMKKIGPIDLYLSMQIRH